MPPPWFRGSGLTLGVSIVRPGRLPVTLLTVKDDRIRRGAPRNVGVDERGFCLFEAGI
jgi:hypothetical protein